MRTLNLLILLLVCAFAKAQTNYVRNGDLEQYTKCPDDLNLIKLANYWSCPLDSASELGMEYYHTCGNSYPDVGFHIPSNSGFYQYPHSGNGMGAAVFYYDKTSPPPPSSLPFDYRDYLQGRLCKALSAGKTYCASFWVNLAESSGYAHNKIGAYLDNGAINKLPLAPGSEITTVTPQVYTNTKIMDTANWVQIEGSFVATGKETYITIGVFAANSAVDTITTNYWFATTQYSYYLIDDVSVVPIDLPAEAGKDTWVEQGKQIQIGRVGDTTAKALNCKWYHKGILIDSGAIISVNANAVKYAVDTYVVVQTICGLVKTDTVLVRTTGLGMAAQHRAQQAFSLYPNPNEGSFVLRAAQAGTTSLSIYDLMGRKIYSRTIDFATAGEQNIELSNIPSGQYLVRIIDASGKQHILKISVQ